MKKTVSVLDILKKVVEDNGRIVPTEHYNRITESKTVEDSRLHVSEAVPSSALSLNVGTDKLNVSFLTRYDSEILMSDEDSEKAGLSSPLVETRYFRYQTLIRDGRPNMYHLRVQPDARLFLDLGILLGGSNSVFSIEGDDLKINLGSLPMVDRSRYKSIDWDWLEKAVQRELVLSAHEKVRAFYKKSTKEGAGSRFTPEQLEVLKKYNLDENLSYVAERTRPEVGGGYWAYSIRFDVRGCAELPSVNSVLKKLEKGSDRFNMGEQLILDSIDLYKKENPFVQEEEKKELVLLRLDLLEAKIAYLANDLLGDEGEIENDGIVIKTKIVTVGA